MAWGGARPNSGPSPKRLAEVRKARAAKANLTDAKAAAKIAAQDAPPAERKAVRQLNFQAISEIMEWSRETSRKRERTREWCPFVIDPTKMGPPPPKKFAMAMDQQLMGNNDWAIAAWLGGGMISNIESEGLLWLGYPLLSELAQRPEYRVMSETIATELTRKWIRFKGTSTASGEKEDDDTPGSNPPSELGQPLSQVENEPDEEQPGAKPNGGQEPEGEDAEIDSRSFNEKAGSGEIDRENQENPESQFEPTRPRPNGKTDDKSGKIKELTDFLEDLKVRDRFTQIALHDGLFGRAHLFLDVGADLDETRGELASPIGNGRDEITKGKLKKGCLKGLRVIEPVWTYPTTYNAQNPLRHDWYNPQVWYVMGKEIHCSRLLTFIGRPVPDLLKPAYSFGGLAMSQMAKPYIDIWIRTRSSVGDLIHSFSVMVLKTDLSTILQPGSGAQIATRVALFNSLRDNQGTFLVNNETEDFMNVSASLSGLHELQAQSQEHMASVARIPLVKFTGIQPSGLNASSEGEIRVWYDTISAYQNSFFRPNLNVVIDIAQVSLWGEVDPDITWDFVPLWSMTEKEQVEVRKLDAETGQILVDTGIISQEEERTRIAADPDSPYPGLDPEDVPELLQEEAMGLEIPHGKPGAAEAETALGEGGGEPTGRRAGGNGVVPFGGNRRQAGDEFEEGKHPRDDDGKFATSAGGGGAGGETEFKEAGAKVDGLTVLSDVPNIGSIGSSFNEGEYTVLRGTREIPFSAFEAAGKPVRDKRTNALAEEIKQSGEIKPLIVVIEQDNLAAGPYILEGSHRFDALQIAGKKSFPAVVVVEHGEGEATAEPEPSTPTFKTKKDHAEHLLKKGVTTKEMLEALGWPSISMPAMAKSLNMRLEKVKEGRVTKYIGHSLGPRAQPEKTHSLLGFLSKRGGLRVDDANISDVRAAIGSNNKFIPGFGQLIREPKRLSTAAQKGGQYAPMDLDGAREAAAEAGYIDESTTLPEFIETIDRELRGQRVYPAGYLPEGRSEDPDELEHQQNGFMQELHNSAGELSDAENARAVELWTHEGINDPLDVLERIALEVDDGEVSAGAEPRSEPIPGWDDDRDAVPF